MEVIKIPWEHVDACLFFRPGGEDGELRGRDTVLRVRRTVGGERERRWKTDAGEMNKAEDGAECSKSGGRRGLG